MNKILFMMALLFSAASHGDETAPEMTQDKGYVEPFKMFDNVYYVGDKWVSSYVVETFTGLVIIDTLDFPYSKWIPINLKKLGLKGKPVTHILVTHGHSDHVGGAQYLQSLYASKVIMTKKGYELAVEQAGDSQGDRRFSPPEVSEFAQDNFVLVVGDTRFKLYITPGHTEGDLSIDFTATDKGKLYRAFVVGGHGVNFQKPELAKQFIASMNRIKTLAAKSPAVTVNLSNHPHKNKLFENRDLGNSGGMVNPFVDRKDFFRFVDEQSASANEKIGQNVRSAD